MTDEVWVVRHGITPANQARTIQGHDLVGLAPEGEKQSQRLGEYLARHGPAFSALVCSDLPRAAQTASRLGDALSLEVTLDPRFRECDYGDWVGLGHAAHQAQLARAGGEPNEVVAPGGESPIRMARRVQAAFDDWVERPGVVGPLLLVTHGGPIQALVTRVLQLPFRAVVGERFHRSNTGYTVLRRRRETRQCFAVVTLNATPHLTLMA